MTSAQRFPLPALISPTTSASESPEGGGELGELIESTNVLIEHILDVNGQIDFLTLLHAFQENPSGVGAYFENKEHVNRVFLPFLDFLKSAFFARDQKIPDSIMRLFREHDHIRDAILSYVERNNKEIMSLTHTEQDNTISYHLLLLEGKDFNVRTDIEADHFMQISTLFADAASRIYNQLGVIQTWSSTNLPAKLARELHHFMTLSETINKLALVCAADFEKIGVSLRLGGIIRSHIHVLIKQLESSSFKNQSIIQKLQFLSGKIQDNFAHGAPIGGSSVHEIRKQVRAISDDLDSGFALQEMANFGGDETEYYSSMMVCEGNRAIAELLGIQEIERLSLGVIQGTSEEKKQHLQALYDIYNFGIQKNLSNGDEVIHDFTAKNIAHEHQIEAIYYIVLFDSTVSEASLTQLIDFFYPGRENSSVKVFEAIPQTNNFFYEEFIIKIIAQIIKRLYETSDKKLHLPVIDWINHSLALKDISHSILSYSKVYLTLSLYYIDCPGGKMQGKEAFIHYQNLTGRNASIHDLHLNPDEHHFYVSLGKIDEQERYGESLHNKDALIKAGALILTRVAHRYRLEAMVKIQEMVSEITTAMNKGDEVYSQEYFNQKLGEIISKNIFYNLCMITIIGDCNNCAEREKYSQSSPSGDCTDTESLMCQKIPPKRGFVNRKIDIDDHVHIVCTYPMSSEKIFEQIFFKNKEIIRKYFLNIFATNNKNIRLHEANTHLQKLAFYDPETGLPNENSLKKTLLGQEKTVVLVNISGYEAAITTKDGEEDWVALVGKIAQYLKENIGSEVYRYSKTILGLVYEPSRLAKLPKYNKESIENMIYDMIRMHLTTFYKKYGREVQFRIGVAVMEKDGHLQLANIALNRAKKSRTDPVYIFQKGDEAEVESIKRNTEILHAALNPGNTSTQFQLHVQRIYDPKNPDMIKEEALARIKHMHDDGRGEIIVPDRFIDIATKRRLLPNLTLAMLPQIIDYLRVSPEIHISINIHEQDWNNDEVMRELELLYANNEIATNRITLEILETVPFDRKEDVEKIRKFQSLGFKISVDDYGERESNMGKVIQIKPNNIKIDRNVIMKLSEGEYRSDAIAAIRSVVSHAKEINATVTAEYIETEEVFCLLRELGVDFFQGYYFGKPVPVIH